MLKWVSRYTWAAVIYVNIYIHVPQVLPTQGKLMFLKHLVLKEGNWGRQHTTTCRVQLRKVRACHRTRLICAIFRHIIFFFCN